MNQLTISDYGTSLGKRSERVSVRYRGEERQKEEHALMDLDQIVIASRGVSLSSDLIEACTERGIEISFLSFSGKPYAKLNSPSLTATVISRREQLAAYHDERGVEIAKRFAAGKLRNQINLVRYFGKYRKKSAPKRYDELAERVTKIEGLMGDIHALQAPKDEGNGVSPIDAARTTLLNLEGRAGALYWECVQRLLPAGRFTTREHQGAADDVNSPCSTTATGYSTRRFGAHSRWLDWNRLRVFFMSIAPANRRWCWISLRSSANRLLIGWCLR